MIDVTQGSYAFLTEVPTRVMDAARVTYGTVHMFRKPEFTPIHTYMPMFTLVYKQGNHGGFDDGTND